MNIKTLVMHETKLRMELFWGAFEDRPHKVESDLKEKRSNDINKKEHDACATQYHNGVDDAPGDFPAIHFWLPYLLRFAQLDHKLAGVLIHDP